MEGQVQQKMFLIKSDFQHSNTKFFLSTELWLFVKLGENFNCHTKTLTPTETETSTHWLFNFKIRSNCKPIIIMQVVMVWCWIFRLALKEQIGPVSVVQIEAWEEEGAEAVVLGVVDISARPIQITCQDHAEEQCSGSAFNFKAVYFIYLFLFLVVQT